MNPQPKPEPGVTLEADNLTHAGVMSPYKTGVWQSLTPGERLARSWAMRSRLPNLRVVHDRKLFPKP
jgi:hypothetical protein